MNSRELILEIAQARPEPDEDGAAAGLLDRARSGDLDAFDGLMRLYEKQVLSTALRLLGRLEDAQDAAQEVFVKLYRSLGRLRAESELAPWLYRVTVNACHDLGRRRRRWSAGELTGLEPAGESANPESLWRETERRQAVERALAALPEKERAAVVLRDIEGLTTREVAEILGSSETTVRSQISTARVKLKTITDRYLRKRV